MLEAHKNKKANKTEAGRERVTRRGLWSQTTGRRTNPAP